MAKRFNLKDAMREAVENRFSFDLDDTTTITCAADIDQDALDEVAKINDAGDDGMGLGVDALVDLVCEYIDTETDETKFRKFVSDNNVGIVILGGLVRQINEHYVEQAGGRPTKG